MPITRFLKRLARTTLMGRLIGYGLAGCGPYLPLKKVLANRFVLAFEHPRPVYPGHLLVVPRQAIPTLLDLAQPANSAYLLSVFEAIQKLITGPVLQSGYVVCVNGGVRQEIKQVHFHLFAGFGYTPGFQPASSDIPVYADSSARVYKLPMAADSLRFVIAPQPVLASLETMESAELPRLASLLQVLPELEQRYSFSEAGYSLIIEKSEKLTLFLRAGK